MARQSRRGTFDGSMIWPQSGHLPGHPGFFVESAIMSGKIAFPF